MSDAVNEFVTREVRAADYLIDILDEWRAVRRELNARGGIAFLESAEFAGENAHITPGEALDAFNALDAIEAAIAGGHLTNLYKLLPYSGPGIGTGVL